jgi:MFS transporter, AAHS family, 4-hydroxybenzoate transporter
MMTTRWGSKVTLAALAAGAVITGMIMGAMPIGAGQPPWPIISMLAVFGALINGMQVGLYGLATHVYPTTLRATGVGTAVSVGRFGAILSTYLGAWMLDRGGTTLFFAAMAASMLLAMISVSVLRGHVPKLGAA